MNQPVLNIFSEQYLDQNIMCNIKMTMLVSLLSLLAAI